MHRMRGWQLERGAVGQLHPLRGWHVQQLGRESVYLMRQRHAFVQGERHMLRVPERRVE